MLAPFKYGFHFGNLRPVKLSPNHNNSNSILSLNATRHAKMGASTPSHNDYSCPKQDPGDELFVFQYKLSLKITRVITDPVRLNHFVSPTKARSTSSETILINSSLLISVNIFSLPPSSKEAASSVLSLISSSIFSSIVPRQMNL